MNTLQQLREQYDHVDCRDLGHRQLEQIRNGLKNVSPDEVSSSEDGKSYIVLLNKLREAVAANDKLHGDNYPHLLNSLLSVGEDGLYSNNLRFIFELIQNVDDCDYLSHDDCKLDMRFDFETDRIVLTYNEIGFTPFNVFAITGIAEAAKNVSATKNEIGEKGIGFKSVFGVADKVLIRSGWFSFELYKENFTIPVPAYQDSDYLPGTQMTLYVPGRAKQIYGEIKKQYCQKDALFSRNPLLFLNKLTSLKMYFDSWRSMEFKVSRCGQSYHNKIEVERNVEISVDLHDYENGIEINETKQINCSRYSYPVFFSREACQTRYGEDTQVGYPNGKSMILQVIFPNLEYIADVGGGALYSFLPTQLKLTVPLICHVPFKLDASREFVDPQDENLWFQESSSYLSELIDYSYKDWCKTVNGNIVQYIPGVKDNLFARNNGKEQCLSCQKSFSGSHYLSLPLFLTMDGSYHKGQEVFCFNQDEQIAEPEKVYRLMGFQDYLFIPPVSVRKLGLKTEKNIKDRLFKRALSFQSVTAEALEYLDSVKYAYSKEQIPIQKSLELTADQIEIVFKHSALVNVLRRMGCESVKDHKRLRITVLNSQEQEIKDVLYDEFELNEAPPLVEEYMNYINAKCVCLDIKEDDYLPCYNAVILSQKNPLASFAAFCSAIDKNDTFVTRIKLREASERLNQFIDNETGSASDYLRNLRNVRRIIKDSLGNNGYGSYIKLILKSGTDRGRYIQELLQNADDCNYLPDVVPTFSLSREGSSIITEYNEVGFDRANIRSITAIGESTKNKLLNEKYEEIGEKGVGFKTIFAVASEVRIFSGEYSFGLTDQEPTIPKVLKAVKQEAVVGTRMEITLKDQRDFKEYNKEKILELCLCLRKLRSIRFDSHNVSIEDSDDRRTITIDEQQYVFKRFTHTFTVTDEKALNERKNGTREVSPEQTITCFVPEKKGFSGYALYSGLPTKHRMKIPMVIDAPFALTTSREEIETGSSAWNDIIRKELYSAILFVIESLKTTERIKVFRFMKFGQQYHGPTRVFINDFSDSDYLNSYNFLDILKSKEILPTFDKTVFLIPRDRRARLFPDVARFLFQKVSQSEYKGILPSMIIDIEDTNYEAVINALGCEKASFERVFPLIKDYAEQFIQQDDAFRQKLYDYLTNNADEMQDLYREGLKQLAIIPVYGKSADSVDYVQWEDDTIFTKKGARKSSSDYCILNENLLSKTECERIFDVNVNEMNDRWEQHRYNDQLKKRINGDNIHEIYRFLISEFQSGALQKNDSFEILYASANIIPMKNELGKIVTTKLFLCDQPSGYFPVKMIQSLIVHKECNGFAEYLQCENLSGIHYDDLAYGEQLTADDVEVLLDDYFDNSEEILRGFYKDGLISFELLREYNLEHLSFHRTSDYEENYEFPSAPVGNKESIKRHVRQQCQNPVEIVPVIVERTIRMGKNPDGSTFSLDNKDAREGALRTYTPEGAHERCFCQMCQKVFPYSQIEANNLEYLPDYYFPQMRVALCLNCSQEFKYGYRINDTIRNAYLETIKNEIIEEDQEIVEIPIYDECSITFTAKHLAEIQETMRQMPNKKENK